MAVIIVACSAAIGMGGCASCSRMWKTPVSSAGGVLKAMAKERLVSLVASHIRRAPVASWRMT